MVRRTILMGLLLIPSLAAAEELDLELGTALEFDSNVFRTSSDQKPDGIFRLLPAATLYRDEGDLRYRLRYAMPFEQGFQYGDDISDFDYLVDLSSYWTYDGANEFFLNDTFRDDRTVTRRFQVEEDLPDVSDRRRRVLTNNVALGLNHAFTPRTTGGLSFSHALWESDQQDRQDNQTFAATADLNYVLTRTSQVGTGFSFTVQDFEQGGGIPASQTFYYNLFGSWVYQIDEVTTFSISAGPTIIQADQDAAPTTAEVPLTPTVKVNGQINAFLFSTCNQLVNGLPVLGSSCDPFVPPVAPDTMQVPVSFVNEVPPASRSDVQVTAFGAARLTRRWTPTISSTLSYRRQQSNASGLGGSTILDAVSARGDWEIDQWWNLQLRADFTKRQSLATQTQTYLVIQEGPNGEAISVQPTDPPPPLNADSQGLTALPVKRSIDTNRWGVGGRLARKIGRRAEASLRLNYNVQSSDQGTRGKNSDFDDFLAILGVRYLFEPISLW